MKQYFCIGSHLPFDVINHSQLNKSKTKQTFSFAKSKRFTDLKPNCLQLSYDNKKNNLSKMGVRIGTEKRQSLSKPKDGPSPNQYQISKKIESDMNCISFGVSRQSIKANNYLANDCVNFPSSTKYQTQSKFKNILNSSPAYTLRKKTYTEGTANIVSPGPARYNLRSNTKNLNLQMTKYKSISFSTGKSKRFTSQETQAPGPGRYKTDIQNSQRLGSGNSRYKSCMNVKFSSSIRKTYIDDQMRHSCLLPGPGQYRAPSEFGQYDGDIYKFFNGSEPHELLNEQQIQAIKNNVVKRPSTSKH